jgi:hypothetical protein
MRQQTVAALQAKVLRLSSAAVAHANAGYIINLASNDVRFFDESVATWMYLWCGPLTLLLVLVMIAAELGWAAATAGISVLCLVIPVQVGAQARATATATCC